MRIVANSTLVAYSKQHSDAKTALESWYKTVKKAFWKDFRDIKKTFNSIYYAGSQHYVFNIKGNDFRLVGKILFVQQTICIRFIGTYEECDKIDCTTI